MYYDTTLRAETIRSEESVLVCKYGLRRHDASAGKGPALRLATWILSHKWGFNGVRISQQLRETLGRCGNVRSTSMPKYILAGSAADTGHNADFLTLTIYNPLNMFTARSAWPRHITRPWWPVTTRQFRILSRPQPVIPTA